MIAIEPSRRLFYEGAAYYGHAVWPSPIISIATVVSAMLTEDELPATSDLSLAPLVFREDSYDPVTRVRRGRFYNRNDGTQPQSWCVQPHPAMQEVGPFDASGWLRKDLFGFYEWPARLHLRPKRREAVVAIGVRNAVTLWKVIGIEQISTGEDLVTLKARSNLGVLPELDMRMVPADERNRVEECLEKVADTAYRSGPESIIDRCRDAAAAVLGVWLKETHPNAREKDLGELVKLIEGSGKVIVEHAAKIIARLHPRAKPNEQVKFSVRPIVEADGELAIECLGTILREIGWAT